MAIKHLSHMETAGDQYTGRNGLYCKVKPTGISSTFLMKAAKELSLPVGTDRQMKLHCTIMWSKHVPHTPRAENRAYRGVAQIQRFEFWKGHDGQGYIVALLESEDLRALHNEWGERGCSHSFADYTPHVTLADELELTTPLDLRLRLLSEAYRNYSIHFYGEYLSDLKA